ncbi:hypothetical protein ACFFOS_17785 [Nocardioides kongjuensis]|uniref:Uncharacterized protein n=1 Tax=Nocardioides kongjuensis TaxID=349522 RepID=A0A852S002_9ACTN|nr:hypothetical protein [Nocardioides kongjuensis]NYD32152.1 hypothetical protein [Nocardioides kongjuensis]
MALLSKSGIATVAVATGLVLTAGTSGAVAGAMITGKQIKNNTVTTKDIKNNNLTGADVADGSLDSADLSAAVRSGLGDLTISGSVSKTGVVTLRHAPAGVGVTAQVNVGNNLGNACVTVTGANVGPANAVIIATPDYGNDDTTTLGTSAIVEATSKVADGGCTNGFRVQTLLRKADNTIEQKAEGFLFQIN